MQWLTPAVCSPYFCYVESRSKIFFVLRAFAAGVVLTTGACSPALSAGCARHASVLTQPGCMAGYVHVLGDAFPILTDPCLGLSTTYPW